MKFSMCIGGLKYNIDCLTEEFYQRNGKKFECEYSSGYFNISVNLKDLESFEYFDDKLSVYLNETTFMLDRVIRHCLDYESMIVHGAAIYYKGNGYLFIAPSGTGKTTHIGLWKKYLQDEVKIINGDKPMLKFGEEITVCGTPWNGKENFGDNISAPLKAIVVLSRAADNSFSKLTSASAVVSLLKHCFYSVDKECGPKVVGYIGRLVKKIPVYSLECNISKEAFNTCFNSLLNTIC